MSENNLLSIIITEARSAATANGGSIADRFKAAARVTKNHWLVTNEDARFRGAVGGVMNSYGEGTPEYERLEKEIRMIRKYGAILAAASAGLEVSPPELEKGFEPIGLLNLWREVLDDK
jgi:pyruvate-formate lyase-activating enzyme